MKHLLIFLLLVSVQESYADPPKFFRQESFNCADFAEAVNHFIAIGETATVAELNSIASNNTELESRRCSYRIGSVCRILFQTKGKEQLEPPIFGSPIELGNLAIDDTHFNVTNTFHLFPIALSGSTYFVLTESYAFGGWSAGIKSYISYCQTNGIFRTEPLTIPSKDQALKDAAALRDSIAWKSLKWESFGGGDKHAWKFIQDQANSMPDSQTNTPAR